MYCGIAEGGVDVVDWNWIMWVCRIARNIADNTELPVCSRERLWIDKGWDLGREVDAVDEDVRFDDLLIWSRLR